MPASSSVLSPAPSLDRAAKRRTLAVLALAALLTKGLWFSASAVVPQLTLDWDLDASAQAWLTVSVQLGFVAGAFGSALLTLADRIPARLLLAGSALVGAVANAAIAVVPPDFGLVLGLRFVTGLTQAGIYPPGMKLVATWCRTDRGFGIGLLVAALTLGSATPHLLNGLAVFGTGGMPPWRSVLWATSGLALLTTLLVLLFVHAGPYLDPRRAPFNLRYAFDALRHRPTRLANFGYLGHMWELYAMWTWVPLLLLASYERAGWDLGAARLAGFAVVGIGAAGCLLAGYLADRLGRTAITTASLVVSGGCALTVGLLFDAPGLLTALCLLWGFAVVADSAQFSAAVSELADPRYVGTALTVQTCLGFLLTLVTIQVVPLVVEALGWERAFTVLALGPAFGIWGMRRLRRHPEAVRLAGGKR